MTNPGRLARSEPGPGRKGEGGGFLGTHSDLPGLPFAKQSCLRGKDEGKRMEKG